MTERWRGAVGYADFYEVSDHGRVRRISSGRILKHLTTIWGYHTIMVSCNGAKKWRPVHRLVAEAWVDGQSQERWQVNHIDGVKTNNHSRNLEWVSPSENKIHSVRIGTTNILRGDDNGAAKLRAEQVLEIRRRIYDRSDDLATEFGVSRSLINMIRSRRRWPHI